MTRNWRMPGPHYVKGFSLIELMVAVTIGLIIAAAAFSAYLGAAGASKVAEAQGRMNDDAQAALAILTQQLRMAGSNPSHFTGATVGKYTLRGCDGKFKPGAAPEPDRLEKLECEKNLIPADPESLAVSYEADKFSTIRPAGGGLASDCLGNKLIPTVLNGLHEANNRFYVDISNSVPSLYCKGSGVNQDGSASKAKALVENIEDMQFIYGAVEQAAADVAAAEVVGYLTAEQLADNAVRWSEVITVRICVLVRSEVPLATDASSAAYVKCDGELETTPPDFRLRRAYHATVVLRNRRL